MFPASVGGQRLCANEQAYLKYYSALQAATIRLNAAPRVRNRYGTSESHCRLTERLGQETGMLMDQVQYSNASPAVVTAENEIRSVQLGPYLDLQKRIQPSADTSQISGVGMAKRRNQFGDRHESVR